jgi:hypothetical protein
VTEDVAHLRTIQVALTTVEAALDNGKWPPETDRLAASLGELGQILGRWNCAICARKALALSAQVKARTALPNDLIKHYMHDLPQTLEDEIISLLNPPKIGAAKHHVHKI